MCDDGLEPKASNFTEIGSTPTRKITGPFTIFILKSRRESKTHFVRDGSQECVLKKFITFSHYHPAPT